MDAAHGPGGDPKAEETTEVIYMNLRKINCFGKRNFSDEDIFKVANSRLQNNRPTWLGRSLGVLSRRTGLIFCFDVAPYTRPVLTVQ